MVYPTLATKENEYVGEDCALCKQPFAPDMELIVCPQDGALHHTYCWEENNNRCTALACEGRGPVGRRANHSAETAPPPHSSATRASSAAQPTIIVLPEPQTQPATQPRPSRRQTRPQPAAREPRPAPQTARAPFTLQLAQSCLVLAIAVAIIVISFSCFGLWAIADYVMIEVFNFPYRPLP